MNLRRVFAMGPSEIAVRSRQAVRKRWDRLGPAFFPAPTSLRAELRRDLSIPPTAWHGHATSAAEELLEGFRRTGPSRFFEGVSADDTIPLLEARLPDARAQMIAQAEDARLGSIDLLGYRSVDVGRPVNWHRDPISGRRTPRVHWSRVDPLNFQEVGDSKVVWELHRHQWLAHLAQGYLVTGDERYAEAFVTTLTDWLDANPPGIGLPWASSLEVSLRLIAWSWSLMMLRGSKALTPDFYLALLAAIWSHATHVERFLSYYFSPNTHLTGEALGLFYAGTLFPEFRLAQRWRRLGAKILEGEVARQVHADGVHFELATGYQRYTVDIYLHFSLLAARCGVAVDPAVTARLLSMLDFLLAVRRPDGTIPEIGDADGGWLSPFVRQNPHDYRALFALAAAAFRRSDYAWAAGGPSADLLWLLGRRGLAAFDALTPAPPSGDPSRAFPKGGVVVMRSGWDATSHHLIFDVGPLGCPVSAAHGHADLLAVQLAAFGQPLLVDPGTGSYAQPTWRDYFRSTAAHTTVLVDGEGQARPAGPFSWHDRPGARLQTWSTTAAFDFADASHDAYCRLADPVVHRRRVLFVKPRYWLIVDDLQGTAQHRVDVHFQFGPSAVTLDIQQWARVWRADRSGILLRVFACSPLKVELHEGEPAPPVGWVSPTYGSQRPAPILRCSTTGQLPLRLVSLLIPVDDLLASAPLAGPKEAKEGCITQFGFDDTGESIVIDSDRLEIRRPGSSTLQPQGPCTIRAIP